MEQALDKNAQYLLPPLIRLAIFYLSIKLKEEGQKVRYRRTLLASNVKRLRLSALSNGSYRMDMDLSKVVSRVALITAESDKLHADSAIALLMENLPRATLIEVPSNQFAHNPKSFQYWRLSKMAVAHPNSPPATHIEVEIIHGLHHRWYRYEPQQGEKRHFSISPDHRDGCICWSINGKSKLSLGVEEWPSHEMPSDASDPVEEPGWWLSFGYDTNSNGMDDRLESIIYGSSESISPTSVVGPDGRKTVAVVINYAWHPGESDANL